MAQLNATNNRKLSWRQGAAQDCEAYDLKVAAPRENASTDIATMPVDDKATGPSVPVSPPAVSIGPSEGAAASN